MRSPGISVNDLALGFLAVIAFVLLLALAQGVGETLGGGYHEWLVPR